MIGLLAAASEALLMARDAARSIPGLWRTATLVVGDYRSWCTACGGNAHPEDAWRHYRGGRLLHPGEGCRARWTAKTVAPRCCPGGSHGDGHVCQVHS